jgi:Leucine-rich repeat (LRR) protein
LAAIAMLALIALSGWPQPASNQRREEDPPVSTSRTVEKKPVVKPPPPPTPAPPPPAASATGILRADTNTAALWHFDDPDGGNTVRDSSGNGNDGQIYGAKWVTGCSGKALRFNGAGSRVNVKGSPSLNISKQITIEALVWSEETEPARRQALLNEARQRAESGPVAFRISEDMTQGIVDRGPGLFYHGGYYLRLKLATVDLAVSQPYEETFGATLLLPRTWYYVAATYDNSTARIYVNGRLDGTRLLGADNLDPWDDVAPLCIGYEAANPFVGILDEVRISNIARTPEEIRANWEAIQKAQQATLAALESTSATARALSFRIKDHEKNEPLADAEVEVQCDHLTLRRRTDTDGRCKVPLPFAEPALVAVTVRKSGYVPIRTKLASPDWKAEDRPNLADETELALYRGSKIGGIVQTEDGKPLGEAIVHVSAAPAGREERGRIEVCDLASTTTAEGRWQCDTAPPNLAGLRIRVEHFDYSTPLDEAVLDKEIAALRKMTYVSTLRGGALARGRVLDADGKPIAGASVAVSFAPQQPPTGQPVTTDSQGRFRWSLPENWPASYASRPQYVAAQAPGFAPDMKVTSPQTGNPPLEFRLQPGRTIRGRVVDKDGKPIQGVSVAVGRWRESYSMLRWNASTDGEGRFLWNSAPPEEVGFALWKNGLMRVFDRRLRPSDEEQAITMNPALHATGTVVDAATSEPIPSFKAIWGVAYGDGVYWYRNDRNIFSNGRYETTFDFGEKGWRLRIEADGYMPADSPEFTADKSEYVFNAALTRHAGIRGVVRGLDGEPLAGADVIMGTPSSRGSVTDNKPSRSSRNEYLVQTGRDGEFRFPPTNEPFSLVVLHDEGCAELTRDEFIASTHVAVTPWGRVEGQVFRGSKPYAGEMVRLMRHAEAARETGKYFVLMTPGSGEQVQTDADGRFVFNRLLPGSHMLYLGVEVKAGQTTRVTLGGMGRPVVGKAVLPPDFKKTSNPELPDYSGTLRLITPSVPVPDDVRAQGQEAAKRWEERWLQSPEAQAQTQTSQYSIVKVEPDGSFSTDSVMAGTYKLTVMVMGATFERDFEMPAIPGGKSDEPLDLGELRAPKAVETADTAATTTATGRILHFPKDVSTGYMGYLMIREQGSRTAWRRWATIRGDIAVPEKMELAASYYFRPDTSLDLSPLSSLGPNDLTSLTLGNSPIGAASLAPLKDQKSLREVQLYNVKVSEGGLLPLRGHPSLESVRLAQSEIGETDWAALEGMPRLRTVFHSNSRLDDAGLSHFKNLPSLEELSLEMSQVSDEGLAAVSKLTTLRKLSLRSTQITRRGVAHLKGLRSLEVLDLGATNITSAGLTELAPLPNLRKVGLSGTKLADADLAPLKNFAALRDLNLDWNGIGDRAVPLLKSLTGLKSLTLRGTKVTGAGAEELQAALPDCAIEVDKPTALNLRNSTYSEDEIARQLKGWRALRSVDLTGTRVGEKALRQLGELAGVQSLDLSQTPLADSWLAHLKGLNGLRELILRTTPVGDSGLAHVAGLTSLTTLNLSNTKITNEGLGHLAKMKSLRALYLDYNRIGDEGLEPLKNLPALEELSLKRTDVTGECVAQLKSMSALKRLDLSGTSVTASALDELKKALPACRIEMAVATPVETAQPARPARIPVPLPALAAEPAPPPPQTVAAESKPASAKANYEQDFDAFVKDLEANYPFFELKGIRDDWKATSARLREEVKNCKSDEAFLGLVIEAMKCLRDSHIGFAKVNGKLPQPPREYGPPICFLPATEGRVVVMAAGQGVDPDVRPGTVVTKIDGKDARTVLDERSKAAWKKGGFFSSPQRAALFEYRTPLSGEVRGEKHTIAILAGDKEREITLTSDMAASGWAHTYNLPKDLVRAGSSAFYAKLPSGVGYIYLRRVDQSTEPGIAKALAAYPDARGWIVDLRGNGGGGYDQTLLNRIKALPRPVACILDAGCISAGETLARDLVNLAGARLFGSRTAGASSVKRQWAFPSGIATLTISTRTRGGIAGKIIEYNGIEPHEPVEAVPEELQRGLNSEILRAEEYLLAGPSTAARSKPTR